MKECDDCFKLYLTELDKDNPENLDVLYQNYQVKRKELNKELFTQSDKKYKNIIDCNDSKRLWGMINWKGDTSSPTNHPPIEELCEHFTQLYVPIEDDGDQYM